MRSVDNVIVFEQVVMGLAHVHRKGILHRDLKPANIFFFDEWHVRIGDFGLSIERHTADAEVDAEEDEDAEVGAQEGATAAALAEAGDHSFTVGVGSPMYSAPEQLRRRGTKPQRAPSAASPGAAAVAAVTSPPTPTSSYDEKADIFSLGVIFFEMFHVFGTEMERIIALSEAREGRVAAEAPPGAEFSSEARRLCRAMLSADPAQRPSPEEILRDPWLRAERAKGPMFIL